MTESFTVVIASSTISIIPQLIALLMTISVSYVEIEKSVIKSSWIHWSVIAETCDTILADTSCIQIENELEDICAYVTLWAK